MANSRLAPSVVEENPLDLHQAFVEAKWNTSSQTILTTRIGRQELSYGSQRLVAVREAPNNRMAFDALKLIYQQKNFKSDAFTRIPSPTKQEFLTTILMKMLNFGGFIRSLIMLLY
jgi:hypothetical protein